jgi:hypothetical protein
VSETIAMRHCMRLSGVLVGALILGCGDTLQPQEVLGSYTLETIQGQAPPLVVADNPGCRITVIGGSLTLGADQRFELLLDEVTVCPTPTEPGEVAELWAGTYSLDGNTVILHAIGDPSVDYRGPLHGGRLTVPLGGRYGTVVFMLTP